MILKGNGKHILINSYTSIGVIAAILLILLTVYSWIDPLASVAAAVIIIYTGFKLMNKSVRDLMDEVDMNVVAELVLILRKNRHANWIDMHNLSVQRHGNYYHVDCHVTMPCYFSFIPIIRVHLCNPWRSFLLPASYFLPPASSSQLPHCLTC